MWVPLARQGASSRVRAQEQVGLRGGRGGRRYLPWKVTGFPCTAFGIAASTTGAACIACSLVSSASVHRGCRVLLFRAENLEGLFAISAQASSSPFEHARIRRELSPPPDGASESC